MCCLKNLFLLYNIIFQRLLLELWKRASNIKLKQNIETEERFFSNSSKNILIIRKFYLKVEKIKENYQSIKIIVCFFPILYILQVGQVNLETFSICLHQKIIEKLDQFTRRAQGDLIFVGERIFYYTWPIKQICIILFSYIMKLRTKLFVLSNGVIYRNNRY